jgi:NitT/TauT family transport system substrate-binding protein
MAHGAEIASKQASRRDLALGARTRTALLLLLLGLLALVACKPEERPLRPVKLGLSWVHSAQYTGFYYADRHGLYAQEGLQVEFVPGSAERDPMHEFLAGKYDFVIAQPDTLAVARLQGHRLKAVAVVFRIHPLVFVSLASSGIVSPQDFRGKTIGIGYSSKMPLQAVLKRMAIDPGEVSVVVDYSDQFARLKKGELDVMAMWRINELQTALRQGMQLNVISPYDYGLTLYADLLVVRESLIEQDPDLVQRIVRATMRGWGEALQDPEASARLALHYDPTLDPVHQLDLLKASIPLIHTGVDQLGWMREKEWERMLRTLHQEGVIPAQPVAGDLYTARFLEGLQEQ